MKGRCRSTSRGSLQAVSINHTPVFRPDPSVSSNTECCSQQHEEPTYVCVPAASLVTRKPFKSDEKAFCIKDIEKAEKGDPAVATRKGKKKIPLLKMTGAAPACQKVEGNVTSNCSLYPSCSTSDDNHNPPTPSTNTSPALLAGSLRKGFGDREEDEVPGDDALEQVYPLNSRSK